MNERLEQMISFLIPAIERASDFHPHLVGEDSIEFKLENDSFARFFLHSENYKGLEIDINRQNREKNETMDFIDEDTGDIDEFPFYIGHIFYKDGDLPANKRFLVNAAKELISWKQGFVKRRPAHLLGKYTAEELKDGMRHKPAELAAKTHYYYPEEQKNIFAVNYYQPKTKKLDESIRLYHLLPLLVGASKTKSGIYTMANKISETTEPRVSIFADKNEAVLF